MSRPSESTGNRRNSLVSVEGGSLRGVGTSRINREIHVRVCERLKVKLPGGDLAETVRAFSLPCGTGCIGRQLNGSRNACKILQNLLRRAEVKPLVRLYSLIDMSKADVLGIYIHSRRAFSC